MDKTLSQEMALDALRESKGLSFIGNLEGSDGVLAVILHDGTAVSIDKQGIVRDAEGDVLDVDGF